MKKINEILDGDQIRGIYFCREKQLKDARNGKQYYNLTLQDNTGTINGKIWDVDSAGIADFEEKGKTDPMFAELAKLTAKTKGLWNAEAEKYLLAKAKSI